MGRTQHELQRRAPSQERSKATVAAILSATARILVRNGYEALNTNSVAEAAGCSVGSLYQYFPNKEALLTALIDEHTSDALAQLGESVQMLGGLPIDEAIPRYIEAMFAMHSVRPELHRAISSELPRIKAHGRFLEIQAKSQMLVRSYLELHRDRIRPENLDLAAFVLVMSVEAVTHAAILEDTFTKDPRLLVQEISALVLGYLSPAAHGGMAASRRIVRKAATRRAQVHEGRRQKKVGRT